jgi:hypothetical protein
MSNYFRILIDTITQNYDENTQVKDKFIEELTVKNIHDEYLGLLIINLLVFSGLTFTAYSSAKKMEATTTNPDDFRPKFIKGLIYANGCTILFILN